MYNECPTTESQKRCSNGTQREGEAVKGQELAGRHLQRDMYEKTRRGFVEMNGD